STGVAVEFDAVLSGELDVSAVAVVGDESAEPGDRVEKVPGGGVPPADGLLGGEDAVAVFGGDLVGLDVFVGEFLSEVGRLLSDVLGRHGGLNALLGGLGFLLTGTDNA